MYSRLFTLFVSFVFVTSSLAIPSSPVVRSPVGAVEVVNVERQDLSSVLSIVQGLSGNLLPSITGLQGAVADPSNVDTGAVQTNLQGIIGTLTSTTSVLQAVNPATVDQSPASVTAIIGVLGPLLSLLISLLAVVSSVVAITPLAPVLLPLIATIGVLLASILTILIGLVSGLLVALIPVLLTLVLPLTTLGFTSILSLIPGL